MTKPLSFDWGDGSLDTPVDSGEAVEHEYAAPGIYTITVSGQDASTAECQFEYVKPPDPPEPDTCTITDFVDNNGNHREPGFCYSLGVGCQVLGSDFANVGSVRFVISNTGVFTHSLASMQVVTPEQIIGVLPNPIVGTGLMSAGDTPIDKVQVLDPDDKVMCEMTLPAGTCFQSAN